MSDEYEYSSFPNEGRRNWNQENLEIPLMLAVLRVPKHARILEIGCGRGVALSPFTRRLNPSLLAGLDTDATLLHEVPRDSGAVLICADARQLPVRDASFDVVIDFGTCYHIARAAQALREIARVLVVGGLYVSETRFSQLLSHPIRSRGRRLPWAQAPQLIQRRNGLLWQAHERVP